MISVFLKSFLKGLEIVGNFNRRDNVKEAHELAKNNRFEEALKILENQKHSPGEKSVACMTIYLLKAVCYAELGYRRSAVNCVNVVLSAGRGSINLVYQYAYSDLKKMAEEIEKEYSLKNE